MDNAFIQTIGLEIHVELKTNSKIFCGCPNVFGGEPNTHCCPICSGFPGTLPVLNAKAVEYTVMTGMAIGAEISRYSKWDRKNYFYPDLPKAWQTSQYDLPLVIGGGVTFEVDGETKHVRINRIHLEEDAGKLIHENGVTKVDYNRGGVPLMEIVTEPDLHSAAEVVAFLEELKSIIRYIGVSDVKMQEGSLRCDVNLSLSRPGEPLGTRTETKNLNSFSSASRAVAFEARRQSEILLSGGTIKQETRRWDDAAGEGYSMRSKENAHDYRYFPEPDLLPVVLSDEKLAELRARLPRLKQERAALYTKNYGLSDYDTQILTQNREVSDLFETAVNLGSNPKKTANFIMGDVLRLAKTEGEDVDLGIDGQTLYQLLALVDDGTLSLAAASKEVLGFIWKKDIAPLTAVEKLGLKQMNDTDEIEAAVRAVIEANPKSVAEYKNGSEKVLAFFVGQVMKATKGKCNPKLAGELVIKNLSE